MPDTPLTPLKPGLRILLVDDEPAMRDVLAALLRHYDFKVDTATDGLDAREKIQQAPTAFDVVITDNQMPRMDGANLIRSLRADNFSGKIVVFSSTLTAEKVAALQALGVSAIIEKGQSGLAVIREIRRLTGTC
jgi:two-component system, cell cycle sensor histidine kinase and response regulator CckA